MTIIPTKAYKGSICPTEIDINSGTALDEVRRDLENGFGILFKPSLNERKDLFELFKLIRQHGLKNLVEIINDHYVKYPMDK